MIPLAPIDVPLPVYILNCSTVVVHRFEMRDRGHDDIVMGLFV